MRSSFVWAQISFHRPQIWVIKAELFARSRMLCSAFPGAGVSVGRRAGLGWSLEQRVGGMSAPTVAGSPPWWEGTCGACLGRAALQTAAAGNTAVRAT